MATPLTQFQLPQESLLDINGKQVYLGNGFVLAATGTSLTDTTEIPLAVIKNPSGSGKTLFFYLRQILSNNNSLLARYYLNPTTNVLGGTTAPVNSRSGFSTASISLCYLGATITSNGTLVATIGSSSTAIYGLDPGNNLLITGQQNTTGTSLAITENVWYEL